MTKKSIAPLGALVLASALALTACGSKNADTSGGLTAAPIKLMVTGVLESPIAAYPESADGAKVAAKAINDAGGVDGHPIEIVTCNDNLDVNEATACVRKAVKEQVTALVGGVEIFSAQVQPILDEAGIPWIGTQVITSPQWTSRMVYPVDGGAKVSNFEIGRHAVELTHGDVVIVGIDSAGGQQAVEDMKLGVEAAGGRTLEVVTFPRGQVDFSGTAAQVMPKKPDAVLCACTSSVDWSNLFKSLNQAGFDGKFSTQNSFIVKDVLASLGEDADRVFFSDGIRPFDDESAETKQFHDEVKKYAGDAALTQLFSAAWLSVHVAADALAGADKYDAASLVKALDSRTDLKDYGLVDGVDFTRPAPNADLPRITNVSQMHLKYDRATNEMKVYSDKFINPYAS
jgi:ABC-type branched-subunit amino acid transport system substrate-binding protein